MRFTGCQRRAESPQKWRRKIPQTGGMAISRLFSNDQSTISLVTVPSQVARAFRYATIRILAKGKRVTGRIWTYVRDDRPFAGPAPPAAVYYASSDRRGQHPQKHLSAFTGILQADCYNGFEPLFDPQKKVLPITPAFCFAHARRGFFELADIEKNAREG